MSFIYPRKVTVLRPTPKVGAGKLPFGGLSIHAETVILKDVPASIQQQRAQGLPEAGLPADPIRGNVAYHIFIPKRSAKLGTINNQDIIRDDTGIRYQIAAAYWNSLGYRCFCNMLEA